MLNTQKNTERLNKKIKHEIKALQILTNDVYTHLEKTCQRNTMKQNVSSRRTEGFEVPIISLDEEFYSQIKLFINGAVQYMDTLRDTTSCLPSIISIPQFSSLPSMCSMLWKRIREVCDESRKHGQVKVTETVRKSCDMISKSTQAVNSCLMHCESCDMSMSLIRTLVSAIIKEQRRYSIKTTHVSNVRDNIAIEMTETSQWGAMNKWAGAIIKDFKWAMAITAETQKQYYKILNTKRTLENEHEKAMSVVQEDLATTRTQLEAEKRQVASLRNRVGDLNKSLDEKCSHIKKVVEQTNNLNDSIKQLNNLVESFKKSIRELNNSQRNLKIVIKSTLESGAKTIIDLKYNMKHTLEQVEQYTTKTKRKQIELLCTLNDSETKLNKLQSDYISMTQENSNLTKQIQDLKIEAHLKEDKLKEEVKKLNSKCTELEKNNVCSTARETLLQSKLKLLNQPDINSEPLKDMENQRQHNKQKIKLLLKENTNLKATITKLKKIAPNAAS